MQGRKHKNHKGLVKRLVGRKGGLYMRRVGINKYATKKTSRRKSSSRLSNLFRVPKHYEKVIRKLVNLRKSRLRLHVK